MSRLLKLLKHLPNFLLSNNLRKKIEPKEGNLELELNGQSSTEYKLGPKEIEGFSFYFEVKLLRVKNIIEFKIE